MLEQIKKELDEMIVDCYSPEFLSGYVTALYVHGVISEEILEVLNRYISDNWDTTVL